MCEKGRKISYRISSRSKRFINRAIIGFPSGTRSTRLIELNTFCCCASKRIHWKYRK